MRSAFLATSINRFLGSQLQRKLSTMAAKNDIQVYLAGTPNGQKIPILLEELGMPYDVNFISFANKDQFKPEFLKISPNNKIPAIVDLHPPFSPDKPLSVFESAAILQYLAGTKYGKDTDLYPSDKRTRVATDEWLYWQIAGLGPMLGQKAHFLKSGKRDYHFIPYAITRFSDEVDRLYSVMERRLSEVDYFNGKSYSIADISIYTWASGYAWLDVDITKYPKVKAWLDRVGSREAVRRGIERTKQ
ncbi:Glutathione S-transferase 7 [Irineochytrium annulatum]|nr:Glutathione S-transferase 7 [Irineochytrium annulatum]